MYSIVKSDNKSYDMRSKYEYVQLLRNIEQWLRVREEYNCLYICTQPVNHSGSKRPQKAFSVEGLSTSIAGGVNRLKGENVITST